MAKSAKPAKKQEPAKHGNLHGLFSDTKQVVIGVIKSLKANKEETAFDTVLDLTNDGTEFTYAGVVASKHGNVPKVGEEWSFMAPTIERVKKETGKDEEGNPVFEDTEELVSPPVGTKVVH